MHATRADTPCEQGKYQEQLDRFWANNPTLALGRRHADGQDNVYQLPNPPPTAHHTTAVTSVNVPGTAP
jgi:hypothetical protein